MEMVYLYACEKCGNITEKRIVYFPERHQVPSQVEGYCSKCSDGAGGFNVVTISNIIESYAIR